MITALGAEAYFVDPVEHDAYVAGVSHLPFIISATLMNTLSSDNSWRDMKTITAGGFRDMTRLAAGGPEMHRDIVLTNREAILRWVDGFRNDLDSFRIAVESSSGDDAVSLTTFFERARDARAEWATQTTREGELLQGTEADLSKEGFGDQMGRMLFGGFMRRKNLTERVAKSPKTTPQKSNGSRDGQ
jgi:prephenate dehydrogenase